jgi:hypothetical protein
VSDRGYLGPGHPVAGPARRLCRDHLGAAGPGMIGQTACGACWEQAIRADERVVVQFDVSSVAPAADPGFVDAVAVEVAAGGRRWVRLTEAERRAAVALMLARGLTPTQIGDRLRLNGATVAALITTVHGEAPGTRLGAVA